ASPVVERPTRACPEACTLLRSQPIATRTTRCLIPAGPTPQEPAGGRHPLGVKVLGVRRPRMTGRSRVRDDRRATMRLARLRASTVRVLVLLAAPLAVGAQSAGKRLPRVAVVSSGQPLAEMVGPDPIAPDYRAFIHTLSDRGWIDGQTVVIERRSA